MPNKMSENSRRANVIVDKAFYEGLEAKADSQRMSVGELIRTALEEKFPEIQSSHAIYKVRVPGGKTVTLDFESLPAAVRKHLESQTKKKPAGKKS